MEITDSDEFEEFFDMLFYVKPIRNNQEKLCIVCQVAEPSDNIWDRYQFVCGHVFHTRCIRKWCGLKQSVNCPYCGDIEISRANRYCDDCKKLGHNNAVDGFKFCSASRAANKRALRR